MLPHFAYFALPSISFPPPCVEHLLQQCPCLFPLRSFPPGPGGKATMHFAAGVVQMLDDFEAALDGGPARRR
jgi:hypothetical protein